MAAKKKAAKAQKAAVKARSNPYVQRLVEDEDLRQNIVEAYESSRDAFTRLGNGKSPSKQIFDDKKLQKNLKEAAESIRDASVALREAPKKQRKGGFGRILLLEPRRRRPRAGAVRGPAQEGARRAVRRRGGVRVHLDDDLRSLVGRADGRHHHLTLSRHAEPAEGRPAGALLRLGGPSTQVG